MATFPGDENQKGKKPGLSFWKRGTISGTTR